MKWISDTLIMYTTQSDSGSFCLDAASPAPSRSFSYLGQGDRQTEREQGDSQVFFIPVCKCMYVSMVTSPPAWLTSWTELSAPVTYFL